MIAFHRLLFRWEDESSLEIEWAKGEEGPNILSMLTDSLVEASIEDEPDRPEVPAICIREDGNFLFQNLQLREQTEYIVAITLPIGFEEAREKFLSQNDIGWPFIDARSSSSVKIDPPRYWESKSLGQIEFVKIKGRLNFGGHIGIANLSIIDPSHEAIFEIACLKINYFDEFKKLLEEISQFTSELLLEIDQATNLQFYTSERITENYGVALFHLRRLMADENLPEAIRSILNNPHNRLLVEEEGVPTGWANRIDPVTLASSAGKLPMRSGGPLQSIFRGLTPLEMPQVYKFTSFDTPENRFVKMFLQELSLLCNDILELIKDDQENQPDRGNKEKYKASQREVMAWLNMITEWLSSPFWRNIGLVKFLPANSQVLQKRADYKQVLESMISLQFSLNLPWDAGSTLEETEFGDIRPIHKLYEFWCFLSLRKILAETYGNDKSLQGESRNKDDFLRITDSGLEVNLARGRRSRCPFEAIIGNKKIQINLFYNKAFKKSQSLGAWQGSYSVDFYPDFSIQIKLPDSQHSHWLHFDAKYRLDYINWQKEFESMGAIEEELSDEKNTTLSESSILNLETDSENNSEKNRQPTDIEASIDEEDTGDLTIFKQADLYKMHTYRDAILGSRGAYVLFPGSGNTSTLMIRNPSKKYQNLYDIPGIGAFPLKPQGDAQQVNQIKNFITGAISALASAQLYSEEIGIGSRKKGKWRKYKQRK